MANKDKDLDQRQQDAQRQKGGLSQEESGGPGSREKQQNQEADGQLEQGKQNDRVSRRDDQRH